MFPQVYDLSHCQLRYRTGVATTPPKRGPYTKITLSTTSW